MKPVIAPIIPDTHGEDVFNLQEILQLFVDREMIKISKDEWDKTLPDFVEEQREQSYGEKTANLVVQFRMQNSLGDGRDVDDATAKAINSLLEVFVNKMKVAGTVLSAEGKPGPNILVKAYHKDLRSSEFLGEAYIREGRYEISYTNTNPDQSKREITNLEVFTYDINNLETSRSKTYFNAPPSAVIDIVLLDKVVKLSEYERMVLELEPLMQGLSFEGLTEEDIDFLVGRSRLPKENILLLKQAAVTAAKSLAPSHVIVRRVDNKDFRIPVLVFYAWFRQGLPTEPQLLFTRSADELIELMLIAIKAQIIPALSADIIQKINEAVTQLSVEVLLAPAEDSRPSLGDVLDTIPGKLPFEKQFIVARVLQDKNNPEIPLGEKLKSAGLEEIQAIAVERTLDFQSFSQNFLPLIKTLQDDGEINSIRELALKVSQENFTRKLIDNRAFPVDEAPEEYTARLYRNLFHAEPTAILRNMLGDDKVTLVEDADTRVNVARFLSNLPATFNIKTTSVYEAFNYEKAFEGIAPEFLEKVKIEAKCLTRVAAIAHAPEVVPVLMQAHVTSAQMVSNMPERQFVRSISGLLGKNGETIAREVHENAVNAQIRNEQALISIREAEQRTGIAILDKAMENPMAADNPLKDILEKNHISWDLLFGDADVCECGECTSVYSAANYYVDLLQYLRNNNLDPDATGPLAINPSDPTDISDTPLQKLFDRRPDLMCLQLTCKNTNTILPYVDLVNEVMESYVANKTKSFNVEADETSGELLAQPQHTQDEAYVKLKDAVYPFTLPYHQPIDEARIYLNSLGTSRHELMSTFRSARDDKFILEPLTSSHPAIELSPTAGNLTELHKDYLDNAEDAEYLGLTEDENVILTKEAFVSHEYWDRQSVRPHPQSDYFKKIQAKPVHNYFGYDSEEIMLSADEAKEDGLTFVKDQFLKRTGLQYLELVELLKTQCLNPKYPKEQALTIMKNIRLSYGFLQTLVDSNAGTNEAKYELMIQQLITFQQLNRNDDPCHVQEEVVPPTERERIQEKEEIKQWVYKYFKTTGEIIVLDNNGGKSFDGRLAIKPDNPDGDLQSDGYIKNYSIYGEMQELIGTISRTTGLITMEPGQPDKEWSNSLLLSVENTAFVNIQGRDYLVSLTDTTDTCNLDPFRLIHLDGTSLTVEEYDHIHRFIRLWRKSGWTISETDYAIVSLGKTKSFDISRPLIHQLAAVKKLKDQTGLELIKLLTFWTNIPTDGEKPLYGKLFLTHNLLGIDSIFRADKNGRYLTNPTEEILKHVPVLMAALNLKSDDIDAVIEYEKIKYLTLENVSKLYRYRVLSKLLGLRVTALISVLPLFENPFADADATLLFLEQWKKIEDAGFDHLQLNYIIKNQDDAKKPLGLSNKTALELAKTLYDGLNAIEEAHQDLKADPGAEAILSAEEREEQNLASRQALATSELLKEKLSLLYDQAAVEKITGILEGTTLYAAESAKGIKDLLRPIPLKQPALIQDYEYLQLDNYPLLRRKINYDSTDGSLQIKGILTDLEEAGSSLFVTDDLADPSSLVTKLTGSDLLSKYLWNKFSANKNKLSDGALTVLERQQVLATELNDLIIGSSIIYKASDFDVKLSGETKALNATNPPVGADRVRLNRMLLEDAYPLEIEKNQTPGFAIDDFVDFAGLASKLMSTNRDPASQYLWDKFSGPSQDVLNALTPDTAEQQKIIVEKFNEIIKGGVSIDSDLDGITRSVVTNALIAKNPITPDELIRLNRLLLEDTFPGEITKNQRVGLNTILENLRLGLPLTDPPLMDSLTIIESQQEKLVHESINGTFTPADTAFFSSGDISDLPDNTVTNSGGHTAPAKRLKFLETYLPSLRKELSHRFIVSTLSSQTGLGKEVADLLVTGILKANALASTADPLAASLYTVFEQINKVINPNYNRWAGDLTPSTEGQYTFIVKNSYSRPSVSIDGIRINFVAQENSLDEWWSTDQNLRAGDQYKVELYRTDPENVYWKTSASAVTPIPPVFSFVGWDGYLIPSVEGEYTFIIKDRSSSPDLKIDGQQVEFNAPPTLPGEWESKLEKTLLAGKGYKLTLTGLKLEDVYWKTADSSITTIPDALLMTGWDGHLIPPGEGMYTFIVKGNSVHPDLSIDGKVVIFKEQPTFPGEWWSEEPQKLQAGKLYKLSLPEVNLESVYWKTATSSVTPIPSASLLATFVEHTAIKAFTHLQKAALLINGFSLSADEIQHISEHPKDFGDLDFNRIELAQFLRLESYTRLRNSLPAGKINILDFFKWANRQAGSTVVEKIVELSGWKKEHIEQLIQPEHFNLLMSELFRNETNLLKLKYALEVVNKINTPIDLLFKWAKPDSDFEACRKVADGIHHAMRAQYLPEDWEQVVKPLSDKLRENQKNALIANLLVQDKVMQWGVSDADGLFEFFLIDVQMDACMETSRIKQAISSVQLFVQRCFLGLESRKKPDGTEMGVAHGVLDRARWDWMQRYRVWEANRKVFLYPENWIESNLRDDKSPFFKELESELLQKDINKQNVEDALKAYLYKVDEVANMEVVGVHIEMKSDEYGNIEETIASDGYISYTPVKLHVFSRTRNAPYFFYYRYLDIGASNWYPWEKIQVDIPSYDVEDLTEITTDGKTPPIFTFNDKFKNIIGNGCYLVPVVWNQRLLIFFPQFTRKTLASDAVASPKSIRELSDESPGNLKAIEYWEIKMACSEYRNGKWTQKQLSKDAISDIPNALDRQAIAKFWKEIYDAANASAKVEAANKAKTDALEKLKSEWNEFLEKHRSTYYTLPVTIKPPPGEPPSFSIFTYYGGSYLIVLIAKNVGDGQEKQLTETLSSNHSLILSYKKYQESQLALAAANSVSTTANAALAKAELPPPLSDISKYVFVPVVSNAGNLLGIKVHCPKKVKENIEQVEIGIFEFNGSNITTKNTQIYTYKRSIGSIDYFHHYYSPSYIVSLQKDDDQSHMFSDRTNTIYTADPLNYKYTFNFHHPHTSKLLGIVNTRQLDRFFKFPMAEIEKLSTTGILASQFKDEVFGGHDNNQGNHLYHELKRPYSIYNWELFFHTPLMLADALSKSQQFEEAMKWYHYVFNPVADGKADNRFWQFSPFKDAKTKNILDQIFNKLMPNESDDDINEWRNNPFKPHLVARSRPVAYMKWVVMKYIDNLVAWGDYLFRQDTIESINQATQLYILAVHILGPRPQLIPKRGNKKAQTYLSLLDTWDANSNAMVELEMVYPFSSQAILPMIKSEMAGGSHNYSSNHQVANNNNWVVGTANVFGFASSTYFCIPNNPKLMGYWDTISDRLFKIRHCENIEGLFRKLPLFEPPIDPALLVKAAAQGLSISSVLNDLNTPMPNYRFYYLLQKALELCGELKSMGGAMLSAIEKKDNETISLIRSRHEGSMLNLVMEIKKQQLEEAQKALEGLQQNRKSPEHRMKYYLQLIGEDAGKVPGEDTDFSEIANAIETPVAESGLKLISYEKEDMDKANLSADLQLAAGVTETLAGILYAIPMIKADVAPMGIGAGLSFGGTNLGQLTQAISKVTQLAAGHLNYQASSASKKGGFLRALQDRVMQANSAGYEIKQIDKQILSQQIRVGIAAMEINNHQRQIENAREIEEFLINKYSNEELYTWMRGSLKTLYRQVYNLAYDLAKKAEKTYCFEKGLSHNGFIQSGYFDDGREGLLAGEQLYVGLKQLESAYQEKRGYDYEITKHVSLRQLNPVSLLQFKSEGICEFDLPEVLFDMDYPGHFKRRIKSLSISVPCIAGPNTSVNATLRLLNNKFRNSSIPNNYRERTDEQDDRFSTYSIPITAIATSSAQNDSGMFELNFKDERYLPFEGAGIISKWRMELPKTVKQFDYNTISDVILHVKYTSSEGGAQLKKSADVSVKDFMSAAAELSAEEGLFTLIDLKHDMPNEWHLLKKIGTVGFTIDKNRLPYLAQSLNVKIENVMFIAKAKGNPAKFTIKVEGINTELLRIDEWKLCKGINSDIDLDTKFTLSVAEDQKDNLEALIMVIKFNGTMLS